MRKISLLFLTACTALAGGCIPQSLPVTPSATFTPTATNTPTVTASPLPTFTPTPSLTPTPEWAFQPAGEITCPILLYHRIAEPPAGETGVARYYVPPQQFEEQMQNLHNWGYTTIPITLLITAIRQGAVLPPRPIIITFDDGDASVYNNAFPIMQKYGYTGVVYLVANYMNLDGYMSTAQVQELATAGWEAGSHSMSHIDMVANPDRLRIEGYNSRLDLQKMLSLPVSTFAYPFGLTSPFITDHVDGYGYQGAVGLGTFYTHSYSSLYYLSRMEVRNGTTPEILAGMLPWYGDPNAVQTPTP